MLQKLKGYRTLIVAALGIAPQVAEWLGAINLDNGVSEAIATAALAAVAALRFFTSTPVGKSA